jgi:hypothetical protein
MINFCSRCERDLRRSWYDWRVVAGAGALGVAVGGVLGIVLPGDFVLFTTHNVSIAWSISAVSLVLTATAGAASVVLLSSGLAGRLRPITDAR